MVLTIVKIGGKLISEAENLSEVLNDIKELSKDNKLILVHGGGPQINQLLDRVGKEVKMVKSVSGFLSRFTDKETVELATMVMAGSLNKYLVGKLQELGLNAVGISGLDGKIVTAMRKDKLKIIDEKTGKKLIIRGDYSGKIESVNDDLLKILLENNYIPVVSSIAMSEEFEALNVDGDRMALNIGSKMKADKLFLVTDVKGLIINDKVVKEIGKSEINDLMKEAGGGMKKKLFASKEALNMGLKEVVICSGLVKNPIISAIKGEIGTSISWKHV